MTDTTTAPRNPSTPQTLPLAAGRWTLDPNHSSVAFSIRHLGISKVRGVFREFDASLVVGATAATTEVQATIQVASINTGNADRDAHVLAPDLLDVTIRPTLEFRSTSVRGADDRWVLAGDLTIGTATAPIELDVELGGIDTYPIDGSQHAGFEARGSLRRSAFDIDFGVLDAVLGDVVTIDLDLQFAAPA